MYDLDKFKINSISKSALLTAMLHYLSGTNNKYPWEILGLEMPGNICTSFTVSIDQSNLMMDEISHSPYPIIKIKMGFDEDELLIPELAKIRGKRFRIDANGGWSPEKAEKMIFLLSRVDVELIEQPTTIEYVDQWKYLRGKSKIPLFVDEGLNNWEDYFRFADHINGVNIKMSKSGGIIEAKRIALSARKDKCKIMLGCMVESSIGIAPAVYLSSLADYFDLDGPLLLEENIATGINFNLENVAVAEDIIGGPKLKVKYA